MFLRARHTAVVLIAGLTLALAAGATPALALQSTAETPDLVVGVVVSAEPRVVPGSGAIVTDVRVLDTAAGGATQLTDFTMAGGEVGDSGMWTERYTDLAVGDAIIAGVAEENGEAAAVQAPIAAGAAALTAPSSATVVNGIAAGYVWDGLHWPASSLPVSFRLNTTGLPSGATAAITAAAQTWEDDAGSYMDYTYVGSTGLSAGVGDDVNVISSGNLGNTGRLAECTVWYSPSTDEINEFDIAFNTPNYAYATDGNGSAYDLQSLATHELGHTLHLADLYDAENSAETMYGYGSVGDTSPRTLASGDIAGIRAIYPLALSTSTLSGTVTSTEGGPLAGVAVNVGGIAFGSTNASGNYSISGIPEGTYNVSYSLSGYAPQTVSVDLTSDNTRSIALAPVVVLTATLSGYVRDTGGSPISGASVNVGGVAVTTTDGSGFYSISGIPQANYNVTYSRSGYVAQTVSVNLNGDVTRNVTLSQPAPLYTLSGIVRGPGGAPLSGVSVNVGGVAFGTTNASGAYSVSGVSAGTYNVTYTLAGYITQTASVDLSANRTLDMTLSVQPIVLSGTVRDSTDSSPLAGVVVQIGAVATGTTDSSGQFLIDNVPAGAYTVTLSRSGYTTSTIWADLTSSKTVTVLLAPMPVTFSGRVVDKSGNPVFGVFVDIGGTGGMTLEDGRFHLAGISRGSHVVTYSHSDYRTRTDTFQFEGGPFSAGDVTMTAIPPSVSISTPPKTMKRSKALKVSGTLLPRHPDETTAVRIYKWRWVNKKWKSYGYSTAWASDNETSTRYSKSLKFSSTGKWRLRAKHLGDERHAASVQSRYVYVTVK